MQLKTPLPEEIRRRVRRRALKRTLIMLALYIVLYYSVIVRYGYRYFADRIGPLSTVLIFMALAVLPPFVSGLVPMLRTPSYEGKVLSVSRVITLNYPRAGGFRYSANLPKEEQQYAVIALIRQDDGSEVRRRIRKYDLDDPAVDLCQAGDTVRYYRGTRYAQILSRYGRHDVDCVECGFYCPKEDTVCRRCGAPLIKEGVEWTAAEEADLQRPEPEHAAAKRGPAVTTRAPIEDEAPPARTKSGFSYSAPVPIRREPVKTEDQPVIEHTEHYKRRVDPSDQMGFFGQCFLLYLITSFISLTAGGAAETPRDLVFTYLAVSGFVPLAFSIYFMRDMPSMHFREGKYTWIGQSLWYLLPAEILRTAISYIPVSRNAFGGFFAPLAHLLWTLFYVNSSGRAEQIEKMLYIRQDYLAYLPWPMLTTMLRVLLLMAAYRIIWGKHARSRAKLLGK